jgi:hypothetical protein
MKSFAFDLGKRNNPESPMVGMERLSLAEGCKFPTNGADSAFGKSRK